MEVVEYECAQPMHFDDFYKLKSEPESVYWAGFSTAPDYEQFRVYYDKELERKERTIIFQLVNGKVSGYVALALTPESHVVEISYGILNAFAGNGLGKAIVKYATEFSENKLNANVMTAWIAETNMGSQKVVCSNGYTLDNEFEMRDFQYAKVKFNKYIRILKQ